MAASKFFGSDDVVVLATLALARITLRQMRLSRHDHDKQRVDRYEQALAKIEEDAESALNEASVPRGAQVPRLSTINPIQELASVLEAAQVPALQIALRSMNPLAPYEIEPHPETRTQARSVLGQGLNWSGEWQKQAKDAVNAARGPFKGNPWTTPLIVGASLLAIVATAGVAAPLVAGAGAAGLAGGAAFVSGLAAIGGAGGMAGGIAILTGGGSLVGLAVSNVSHAIAVQPASALEASIVDVMATAALASKLELPRRDRAQMAIIEEALEEATRRRNDLKATSDPGASSVKEAQKRVDALNKAADWMAKRNLK